MGSVLVQNPVGVPSSDRVEPGSYYLPVATYPTAAPPKSIDADSVASNWVDLFNKTVSSPSVASISDLFLAESYWRDQLCLSWDFHCMKGQDKVVDQLQKSSGGSRIKALALDKSSALRSPTAVVFDADGKVHTVQAFLTMETDVGSGAGVVNLVHDEGKWKVFTLFTFLKELKGHEESIRKNRPFGVKHGERASRQNWLDRRSVEKNFEDGQEPIVLILGKSSRIPSGSRFSRSLTVLRCRAIWTHCGC